MTPTRHHKLPSRSLPRALGDSSGDTAGWKWQTHKPYGREAETAIAASLRRQGDDYDGPPDSAAILDHLQKQHEIERRELAERQRADAKQKADGEAEIKREARRLAAAASENEGLMAYGDVDGVITVDSDAEEGGGAGARAESIWEIESWV